jgi:hypothetical protein
MGYRILHDPIPVIGHCFRSSFDYQVPIEELVANQLRMARKHFTHGVWSEWVDCCWQRNLGSMSEHPEGAWARIWEVFQSRKASVEQERAILQGRRVRDEFWYAERFGLSWPKLHGSPLATPASQRAMALAASPSPSPSPCPNITVEIEDPTTGEFRTIEFAIFGTLAPTINVLNLADTAITDEGLARVGSWNLATLNLQNTQITDKAVDKFSGQIKLLLLKGTGVTSHGVEKLRKKTRVDKVEL